MVWQLLTWPAQSLLWLAEQIRERAEAQLDSKENLQKELTALQIQLDLLLALEALAQAEAGSADEDP
jgi:hypothetical protein